MHRQMRCMPASLAQPTTGGSRMRHAAAGHVRPAVGTESSRACRRADWRMARSSHRHGLQAARAPMEEDHEHVRKSQRPRLWNSIRAGRRQRPARSPRAACGRGIAARGRRCDRRRRVAHRRRRRAPEGRPLEPGVPARPRRRCRPVALRGECRAHPQQPEGEPRTQHARTPHHLLNGTITPNSLHFTIIIPAFPISTRHSTAW